VRDPKLIADLVSAIGSLLIAIAILVVVVTLRGPFTEWLKTASKVTVGPFELEREIGKIADQSKQLLKDTSKLQLLIAESRAIEVEVFLSYPLLSEDQRRQMQENLDMLKQEIKNFRNMK
jgi:hypothetical protein